MSVDENDLGPTEMLISIKAFRSLLEEKGYDEDEIKKIMAEIENGDYPGINIIEGTQ